MTWAALAGTDLLDWIALRRVSDGGVTNLGGCWLDGGRRVPGYVTETLGELLAAGLIVLADQQPGGMRRSTLTDCGAARYQRLAQQRQAVPDDVISGWPRVEPFPASAPRGRPVPHEADRRHPPESLKPTVSRWWVAVCLIGVVCLAAGQWLGRAQARG